MNVPKWVWLIIGVLLILVLVVVLKMDFHLGQGGCSVSQGLVH